MMKKARTEKMICSRSTDNPKFEWYNLNYTTVCHHTKHHILHQRKIAIVGWRESERSPFRWHMAKDLICIDPVIVKWVLMSFIGVSSANYSFCSDTTVCSNLRRTEQLFYFPWGSSLALWLIDSDAKGVSGSIPGSHNQ